jgi:hypothetical protein
MGMGFCAQKSEIKFEVTQVRKINFCAFGTADLNKNLFALKALS